MNRGEIVSEFIASVSANPSLLSLIDQMFTFIESNEDMKKLVNTEGAVCNILQLTIKNIFNNDPSRRDEYLLALTNLFGDTHNIGVIVTLLMKEVNTCTEMSGSQKKIYAEKLFSKIIEYSSLDDANKQLSLYAFSGIVEAVIWARNGGLEKMKKRCCFA